MQEQAAAATAIAMYLSCVRRLLKKTRGYECQEADSTFMLAFERPVDAVQFCLLVSSIDTGSRYAGMVGGGRCELLGKFKEQEIVWYTQLYPWIYISIYRGMLGTVRLDLFSWKA